LKIISFIMDQEPLGILLYGYDEPDSLLIKDGLENVLGREITLLSATGRTALAVADILDLSPPFEYASEDTKILLFLGFAEDQLEAALDGFPCEGGIKRPIFCTLTEQNLTWPFERLIEHLLEEDRICKQATGKRTGEV
jgi:hypothetical protein